MSDERPKIINLQDHLPVVRSVDPYGHGRTCRHKMSTFEVDQDAGLVRCNGCQAVVDPLVALVAVAEYWDRHHRAVKYMLGESAHIRAEIDELKRQRKNLRAQVKRLASKSSPRPT